jgi:hypothetical protein
MRFAMALLVAAAFGQPSKPPAIVRGELLDSDALPSGELSVRTASSQVYRFSYDTKTYFERENRRSTPDRLRNGDTVEIVSDNPAGGSLNYARTVHVIERESGLAPQAARRAVYRIRAGRVSMGDLTFAGTVSRVYADQMVLRMRQGADQTIALSFDTVFVANGIVVDASALKPAMRVFVRGAKDLDNQVVASQVAWGQILETPR